MNKKNIIIIVVGIAIFLTAGLFYTDQQKISTTNNEVDQLSNNQAAPEVLISVDIEDLIDKIDKKYLDSNQFKICAKDPIINCMNQSINNRVNLEKDVSICDDFWQEAGKESCRSVFISSQAMEEKDIKLCESLKNSDSCKTEVIRSIAMEERDIEKCEELKKDQGGLESDGLEFLPLDNFSYDRCKSDVIMILVSETGDKKYCESLSGIERTICLDNPIFVSEDIFDNPENI